MSLRQDSDLEKVATPVSDHVTDVPSDEEVAVKSRGVARIEAVKATMDNVDKGRTVMLLFAGSLLVAAWASSLESSTTYNYTALATSALGHHAMISTVSIAGQIMSAICKPFLAKIADLTSRPLTYIFVLLLYIIGYICSAAGKSITAYVIGTTFISIGGSGLDLLQSLVVADLTPLKWRGFMTGMLSTPYLITTWFAGLIVEAIMARNWRWGYGMFAILMPVALSPAIGVMLWLDHKAQKEGKISLNDVNRVEVGWTKKNWTKIIFNALIEIDAFGLILLGFSFSLLLLPFSLYSGAVGGWNNPSMIAMLVVGGVLLITFFVYEIFFCPFPSMPKRIVFNRTFAMAIIIDTMYMFAGYIYLTYYSSWVYIVTDWNYQQWVYFNNTLTMGLCFFGAVAGAFMRYFHRYKYMQIFGLVVKIIGYGIVLRTGTTPPNAATFVVSQVLIGAGGAFSVVASGVASQASVPHQDVALAISLLSLWSYLFAAIGSAVAAPIWSSKTPAHLFKYLPANFTENATAVYEIYGDMTLLKSYPIGDPIRDGGIKAYTKSMYYMVAPTVALSFIPLIASCFQTNYYLGDQQNAVEGHQPEQYPEHIKGEKNRDWKEKITGVFSSSRQ